MVEIERKTGYYIQVKKKDGKEERIYFKSVEALDNYVKIMCKTGKLDTDSEGNIYEK